MITGSVCLKPVKLDVSIHYAVSLYQRIDMWIETKFKKQLFFTLHYNFIGVVAADNQHYHLCFFVTFAFYETLCHYANVSMVCTVASHSSTPSKLHFNLQHTL